jgi:hypothetical protein
MRCLLSVSAAAQTSQTKIADAKNMRRFTGSFCARLRARNTCRKDHGANKSIQEAPDVRSIPKDMKAQ